MLLTLSLFCSVIPLSVGDIVQCELVIVNSLFLIACDTLDEKNVLNI